MQSSDDPVVERAKRRMREDPAAHEKAKAGALPSKRIEAKYGSIFNMTFDQLADAAVMLWREEERRRGRGGDRVSDAERKSVVEGSPKR